MGNDAPRTSDEQARPCFHNLFNPGRECKKPAKWIAGGCALTGHFTYCDEHIGKDNRFKKALP